MHSGARCQLRRRARLPNCSRAFRPDTFFVAVLGLISRCNSLGVWSTTPSLREGFAIGDNFSYLTDSLRPGLGSGPRALAAALGLSLQIFLLPGECGGTLLCVTRAGNPPDPRQKNRSRRADL